MKALLCALAGALLWPANCIAQRPALAGIQLTFGESPLQVASRLRGYLLKPGSIDSASGTWTVSDTARWAGSPQYGNVGFIRFTDGKLTSVSRNWIVSEARNDDAGAIMALLEQLDGEKGCTIERDRVATPALAGNIVRVRCGHHMITVGVTEQDGRRLPLASETWGSWTP